MFNLSILFLSHLEFQNSPFISSSCQFQKNTKLFSNIFYSKSFSNFFYCTYDNNHIPSCFIKCSKFSNFLSQSILLQKQIFLSNQIYELTQQYFDEDIVEIWNCIFRKFYLPNQHGAAIYTTYDIQLFNVCFDDIVSNGGAFYTECQLKGNYVSFIKVKANKSACFISKADNFSSSSNNSIKLKNSLINDAISEQNYGFSNHEIGCTFFLNSNVTKCQSIKSTGMIECYFSDLYIKYVSFSFVTTPKNAISLSFSSNQCQLSYCLFNSICCDQNLIRTINVTNICLEFCFFSSTIYKYKKSIKDWQIHTTNCKKIKLISCCFDAKKDEIFDDSQFDNIEIDNNFFSIKKCFDKALLSKTQININNVGYSYQRTPTYNVQIAPSPTHNFFFDDNNKFILSIDDIDSLLRITFSFLCFLLCLMACTLLYNTYHYFFRHSCCIFNYKDSREML